MAWMIRAGVLLAVIGSFALGLLGRDYVVGLLNRVRAEGFDNALQGIAQAVVREGVVELRYGPKQTEVVRLMRVPAPTERSKP